MFKKICAFPVALLLTVSFILLSLTESETGKAHAATESYQLVTKWGSNGSGDGQFTYPRGIAVDASGNIYVCDSYNCRVQKFNSSGTFITKWGSFSTTLDGKFNYPNGIAVDSSGNVYVADGSNQRIQKFDSSGTFITKWGSSGSGDSQFSFPYGVAVDSSGNVYVADSTNHRIQKFDSSGAFITKWGSSGSGDGQFYIPRGIAVDASGYIYVSDQNNHRIQKFNSNGAFITKWGSSGTGDGQFNRPLGVAVDTSGNVFVADEYNNRIQKFNSIGTFITKWGSNGSGDSQFIYPWGTVVDTSGNVYVTDTYNNRIQKFSLAASGSAPTVTTGSATNVTSNTAILNGTVNANGLSTNVWFDYGIASGSYTNTSATEVVSGSSVVSVGIDISGLSAGTPYYYRIAAQNSAGTSYGSENSFTASALPTTTSSTTTSTTTTTLPNQSDTQKPTGSVSINSGSAYTNSSTVTLTLSATDNTGVVGYYISTSSTTPSASALGWNDVTTTTSYSGNISYILSNGDGTKTLYVWYKDAAGNVSDVSSDDIILDTTTPTVTIMSPTSDAIYTTTNSTIDLSGNASDTTSGVSSVKWSNDKGGSGTASGTTSWSISGISLSSGDNVITVTAKDGANNSGTDTLQVTYGTNNSSTTTTTTISTSSTTTMTTTSSTTTTTLPPPTPVATGVIVGSVVDSLTTSPISGAIVSANGYSGTTVPDGSYVIPDVPAGDYTLTAASNGYTSLSQSITVVGGSAVLANFALLPAQPTPSPTPGGGMVFGSVYDEDDFPLQGVTVTIESNSFSKSAETNEDGYYLFDGLGAGNYKLTYEKEGYETQTQDISLEQDEVKDLEIITIEVEPISEIYGYVVNIKGNPIEFVRLKLKGIKTKIIKTASSDADGFFEFTDLETDTYIIFAKKKRYKNTQRKVKLGEGESEETEIVMKRTSKRVREMVEDGQ